MFLLDLSFDTFPFNEGDVNEVLWLLADDELFEDVTGDVEMVGHVRTPSLLLIAGVGGWWLVLDFLCSRSFSRDEDFVLLLVSLASTPELTVSEVFIFRFLRFNKTLVFLKIR